MTSVRVLIESRELKDFDEYHLFLLDNAVHFGMGRFFVKKMKNKIEVRVAGVDEGIKRFYESLMENTKKYGIDNIKQPEPYSGYIPTIDSYLHFAILVGACKFNEALRGDVGEIDRYLEDE